jgi:hypothetical protein
MVVKKCAHSKRQFGDPRQTLSFLTWACTVKLFKAVFNICGAILALV